MMFIGFIAVILILIILTFVSLLTIFWGGEEFSKPELKDRVVYIFFFCMIILAWYFMFRWFNMLTVGITV